MRRVALDAVGAGHLHVHADDVETQFSGELERLGAVSRLADDLDASSLYRMMETRAPDLRSSTSAADHAGTRVVVARTR